MSEYTTNSCKCANQQRNSRRISRYYGIVHSDCYEIWGMKRTGCAGCPLGKRFEEELELIQKYEPKFYKACMSVFGDAYEYTRKFEAFRKEKGFVARKL